MKNIGFGNGSIIEDEWAFFVDNCPKANKILEIGSGNSTLHLMKIAKVDSLETNIEYINYLTSIINNNVTLYHYNYPHFPNLQSKYDVALIDGPGPNNNNGRLDSMIFAKSLSNNIFIHDCRRKSEKASIEHVFDLDEWEEVGIKRGLLFLRKIIP